MPVERDPDAKLAAYAHPERLVTTEWLAARLGQPGLVVAESDEDVLLYETGHIPGAVKIDWHNDLNDPLTRDYVDPEGFARLMRSKGITRDTTIVFYGDNNNWWAAYALWVCSLFGHADVRLLDGGRSKWLAEGREITREVPQPAPADYPVVPRDEPRNNLQRHAPLSLGMGRHGLRDDRRAARHVSAAPSLGHLHGVPHGRRLPAFPGGLRAALGDRRPRAALQHV